MKRISWCAGLLATACATGPMTAAVEHPTMAPVSAPDDDVYRAFVEAWGQSREDLLQLGSLEVFEVGELWMSEPINEHNCYGTPCLDEVNENQAVEATDQAKRLADLVARAALAIETRPTDCGSGQVDAELAALRDLQIVEIGELLLEEAEADPNCYNLPCPAEIERVEAANCDTAAGLTAIARAARGL